MPLQKVSESTEVAIVLRKAGDHGLHLAVLGEEASDRVVGDGLRVSERWNEGVLLSSKVRTEIFGEELAGDGPLGCQINAVADGLLDPEGPNEAVMVVVRERDEARIASGGHREVGITGRGGVHQTPPWRVEVEHAGGVSPPGRVWKAQPMARSVPITGLGHIGIRVHDLGRSRSFYELLGFEFVAGPVGPEPVAILHHPSEIEINLILNAPEASTPNVLMDVEAKHPGYTHVAFSTSSVDEAKATLEDAGVVITEGPITFPGGSRSIFVRDPDGNVVEINESGRAGVA